jgi:hypothetical protein
MNVTRKLIGEVLLCSLAAAVTACFVVVFQIGLTEARGPQLEGLRVTLMIALVAAGAFPVIFAVCVGYFAPVVIGLHFTGVQNLIQGMKRQFPVALLGFLFGVAYWALIDLLVPWYPANRDQVEIKLASYLGSGVGIAIAFLSAHRRIKIGEQAAS